eukprot:maker-scaffold5_size1054832-snap-gene-5.9 protein:Tk04038 transcript:maker-scaffold5_size1054832-snap-gene-5.9-mRNA-1 annotation:"AGAP009281-PA"
MNFFVAGKAYFSPLIKPAYVSEVETASNGKMMQSLVIALCLTLLSREASGQELSFGQCQTFPVIKNFQPDRYLGKWYEYSNYFFFFQLFGKCVTATYTDNKGQRIGVLNQSINEKNGRRNEARGEALLKPGNQGLGRLIVNFDDQPFFVRSNSPNYFVVDTDYENFSIVYTCQNRVGILKSEILWILTRERFPSQRLIQEVISKIKRAGLDPTRLRKTDQNSCPDNH